MMQSHALLLFCLAVASEPVAFAFLASPAAASLALRHSAAGSQVARGQNTLCTRVPCPSSRGDVLAGRVALQCNSQQDPKGDAEAGPLLKAVWVAAEALGNAAASVQGKAPADLDNNLQGEEQEVLSREELLSRLQVEYDNEYFISGKMDISLYEEDCLFADPFASFNGRERFKNNLSNLGLFVSDSECRLLSLGPDPEDSNAITSRVMVKLQLKLPWAPVLAWPWGVKHVIDSESGRITEHIESWEIDAGEGVAQVFRPGPPNGLAKSKKSSE